MESGERSQHGPSGTRTPHKAAPCDLIFVICMLNPHCNTVCKHRKLTEPWKQHGDIDPGLMTRGSGLISVNFRVREKKS